MRSMTWVVRAAALYNASGAVVFLTPGALGLLGVASPYSSFWLWLPALMGLFAGIVLVLSSFDLRTYGILGIPSALGRTHWQLLTNRLAQPVSPSH